MKSFEGDYHCLKCSACCRVFKLQPANTDELKIAFEKDFGFKLKSYDFVLSVKGECEHLKNNRCTIYDTRPKRCKDFLCQRHIANDQLTAGTLYKKRCRICQKLRTFQAGTDRDIQSVCGNCWIW